MILNLCFIAISILLLMKPFSKFRSQRTQEENFKAQASHLNPLVKQMPSERTFQKLISCLTTLTQKLNSYSMHREQAQALNNNKAGFLKQKIIQQYSFQKNASRPVDYYFDRKSNANFFELKSQPIFQNVDISLPQSRAQLVNWLGKVCKNVFSAGFSLFKNGEVTQNQLKAFCSQNVLRNIIYFAQKHSISQQEVEATNQALKELLQYFLKKYPESEQAETNNKFANELIERDILNENEYDMVYKSGVKFSYDESGNYNTQIMQFLNFIIRLPNTELSNKKEQKESYNSKFRQKMKNLFEKVYSEKQILAMEKYNPKKQKDKAGQSEVNIPNIIQKLTEKYVEEIQQQINQKHYEQKVKSYTSFLIGQKISSNFSPYQLSKIDAGLLTLNTSAMMRVITKWSEELAKCFDKENIVYRQSPFRLNNGSQKYFDKHGLYFLNYLLQQEHIMIVKNMEKIKSNNYFHQSCFLQKQPNQSLAKFSVDEAIVGQFASSMLKNNENYLISYLNMLIHGINKAALQFSYYLIAIKNETNDFQHLRHYLNQNPEKWTNKTYSYLVQQLHYKFKELSPFHDMSEVPELVTFKIGDLLRCKCISKQRQIIALYRQVERMSADKESDFKILRVKNRLSKGNKDILMNLLFKNTILVEMQLAIKEDKSKFIEYSGKFNHYLYELQRAEFGPISEMCAIWMSKDFRAQFYLEKTEKLNLRSKQVIKGKQNTFQKQLLDGCCKQKKEVKNMLPFSCRTCKCFYSQCNFHQRHIYCQNCQQYTCFLCQFEHSTQESQRSMISLLKQVQEGEIEICESTPEQGGVLVSLKSKAKASVTFYTWLQNGQYYLFSYDEKNGKINLVEKVGKKRQKILAFFRQNIIYTSNKIRRSILDPPRENVSSLINQYQDKSLASRETKNAI